MANALINQSCNSDTMKKLVLDELRKRRCRITPQRQLIIDIILENQCSSCKEIHYRVSRQDSSIGIATVYRMLSLLEEIGVISRKNMYQIQPGSLTKEEKKGGVKTTKAVFLDADNKVELLEANWYNEVKEYLKKKGMIQNEDISIVVKVKKPSIERMD